MAGWLRLLPIPGVPRRVEDWRWWPQREVGGGSCSRGVAVSFLPSVLTRKRVDRCNGELLDEEAHVSSPFFLLFPLLFLSLTSEKDIR